MKNFIYLLIFSAFSAQANLENCMKDARDYGYKIQQRPQKVCRQMIERHPRKIEVKSASGLYQITALGNILYLDTYGEKDSKTPIIKDVLAGDQSDLKRIRNVWIFEEQKRFIVLQAGPPYALLSYNLGRISNTSPIRHVASPMFNELTGLELLDEGEEIALFYKGHQLIRFINADADNVRYKGGKFTPKLLREIKGEHTLLRDPQDVVISKSKKEIYVLDSGRILAFDSNALEKAAPRVIGLPPELQGASELEAGAEDGRLSVKDANGNLVTVFVRK